jgi:hypothetical protein
MQRMEAGFDRRKINTAELSATHTPAWVAVRLSRARARLSFAIRSAALLKRTADIISEDALSVARYSLILPQQRRSIETK